MRMVRANVNVKVTIELVAESVLREHASDGVFENTLGIFAHEFLRCCEALATRICGVVYVLFLAPFVTGEFYLFSIDNDNVVTTIEARCVIGFRFAFQNACDHCCETADYHFLCID